MYQYGETVSKQRERMSCAPADTLRRVHQKNRLATVAFVVRSLRMSQFRYGSLCFSFAVTLCVTTACDLASFDAFALLVQLNQEDTALINCSTSLAQLGKAVGFQDYRAQPYNSEHQ